MAKFPLSRETSDQELCVPETEASFPPHPYNPVEPVLGQDFLKQPALF